MVLEVCDCVLLHEWLHTVCMWAAKAGTSLIHHATSSPEAADVEQALGKFFG